MHFIIIKSQFGRVADGARNFTKCFILIVFAGNKVFLIDILTLRSTINSMPNMSLV